LESITHNAPGDCTEDTSENSRRTGWKALSIMPQGTAQKIHLKTAVKLFATTFENIN